MNRRYGLLLLVMLGTATLVAGVAAAQNVVRSSWGQVKAVYSDLAQTVEPQVSKPSLDRGVTPQGAAPVLGGYNLVKASAISTIYDRNDGDTDWLVTFDLPIRYCPAYRQVWAMTWYGAWYNQSGGVQLYSTGINGSGGLRMSFLFGRTRAIAYGIAMSPSNWALYYR